VALEKTFAQVFGPDPVPRRAPQDQPG